MTHSNSDMERVPNDARINLLGTRVQLVRAETFVDYLKRFETIFGPETGALFYEAGIRIGRRFVKAQLQSWPERDMEFLQKWIEFYDSRGYGWFNVKELDLDLNTRKGTIRITQSFIGDVYGPSTQPVCDLLAGFFVGGLEVMVGQPLTGEEITCIAKEDPVCTFKIEPVEE